MRWFALWAAFLSLAACQASTPPSLSPAETPLTAAPMPEAQSTIWLEQAFGGGALAVYFYSAEGVPCVRFLADLPAAQPVSACATPQAAAVVAQGIVQGADAQPYTIIAVRALQPEVSVVVIELRSGESYPLEIVEGGALLILPQVQQAWQAAPIDAYGNLVGALLPLAP